MAQTVQIAKRSTRGSGLLESTLAQWRYRVVHPLLPKLKSGGSILDLGCGYYPVFLSQVPWPHRVGIDKAPCDSEVDAVLLHKQDLCENHLLPFPDDSFDAVTMLATLEHIPPPQIRRILQEVLRVLRKGGRFIFTTPTRGAEPILWFLTRIGMVSREEIEEHHTLFTKTMLQQLLMNGGFRSSCIHMYAFQCGLNLYGYAEKTGSTT